MQNLAEYKKISSFDIVVDDKSIDVYTKMTLKYLRFFEDITVSFSVKKCSKSKKENVKQSEY
jgi:hypothetical protein